MIVYRFAHPKFASDLSGTGARLVGGRWNPRGVAVTYTSEHISLALLEILANTGSLEDLQLIQLVEIDIPDTAAVHEIKPSGLKKNWFADFEYTQWLGKEIMQSNQALLIKCPSVIVPSEHNFLINPLHPEFKKIKLVQSSGFRFDERLFKTNTTTVSHK